MTATMQMLGNWNGAKGSLEITQLSQSVVYLRCAGANEQPAGPLIERSLERHFEQFPTLTMFWDLAELKSYHSDLRVCTTRVLISHRDQLQGIHAYARSKLVWMGISVASVALGDIVTNHRTRESFDAALQALLEETRDA